MTILFSGFEGGDAIAKGHDGSVETDLRPSFERGFRAHQQGRASHTEQEPLPIRLTPHLP